MSQIHDALVASGRYQDAGEVLREGLHLLEHQEAKDAARISALREAADKSWADLASGAYDDIIDENPDDFIGQLGVHATTQTNSADS